GEGGGRARQRPLHGPENNPPQSPSDGQSTRGCPFGKTAGRQESRRSDRRETARAQGPIGSAILEAFVVSLEVQFVFQRESWSSDCPYSFEHQLMFVQFRYRARQAKLAAMHHGDTAENTEQLRKITADDQNRFSGSDKPVDPLINLRLASHIDAPSRLVEQKHIHAAMEQPGKCDFLLIAT